jgi:hypothetical protein
MCPAKSDDAVATGVPVAENQWSSGLFDCFDDCGLCKQACLSFVLTKT